MIRHRPVTVSAVAGLLVLAGCSGGGSGEEARQARSGDGSFVTAGTVVGRADFQWVIPKGTAAKVALIDHDQIFPPVMYAKVGQSIRIVNEDSIGYTVGPFYIGPHQTLEQVFQRTGVFEGACTTHRDGRIVLIIE